MFKKYFPFLIVILFAVIASISLFRFGLPPTHDGEYHVVRFYEFYKTFINGDFYPRWASDLNFGYGLPLFNYVYPLPNFAAALLHILGFSFIDSFKMSMFIASIIGAVFMYLWAKDFWGENGGIVSSVFYTFSPYHFVDIYVRGSVGEVWAIGLFPAVLWSMTEFSKYRKMHHLILSSVFLAMTIFSHNILGLMFFPLAFSYAFFINRRRKELQLSSLTIFILALGLSAIFWLPALLEKKYVVGLEIFDVFRNFPDLYQLIIPSWGSGFFGGDNLGNQMSAQIGLANLLIVTISPVIIIVLKKRRDSRFFILLFFLAWFIILFFLMTHYSVFFWKNIPFMNYFQFPWRFLSLTILVCSFIAGSIPCLWKPRLVSFFLVILTFSLGIGYTKPAYYLMRNDSYYTTRSNFIDSTNSPGNVFNTIWISEKLKRERYRIRKNLDIRVNSELIKPTKYQLNIFAKKNTKITINTLYFPGWEIFVDKNPSKAENKNGLISFSIPRGEHELIVRLGLTAAQRIASIISFIAAIFLVLILFKGKHFVTI